MADPHVHLPNLPDDLPPLDPADRPLVITHKDCPDGWCAEWLFRRHFGDRADYLACKHGDPVPIQAAMDRPRVYVADFSWPLQQMVELAEACGGRMIVLDHHASAESVLFNLCFSLPGRFGEVPGVIFNLAHSGAYLVWRYLKDAGATDEVFADGNPPLIVQYVQDRDLWRWELPGSQEINAALSSYPRVAAVWYALHEQLKDQGGYWELFPQGAAILRKQDQEVDAACRRAVEMTVAGHRVLVANTTVHHSEIGERLAAGRAFSATYYDDLPRGLRVWSLRSRGDGIDVSAVAKRFAGGGHRQAAGFQQSLTEPLSAVAGDTPYHLETQHTLAT